MFGVAIAEREAFERRSMVIMPRCRSLRRARGGGGGRLRGSGLAKDAGAVSMAESLFVRRVSKSV